MASTAETITNYPYLEVPDINQTTFYSIWGPGYIRLDGGDSFLKTRTDWFTKSHLGEDKAKEYDHAVSAVRILNNSGFFDHIGYRCALDSLDMTARHLADIDNNFSLGILRVFVEEVKQKRLEDFQAQADEATLAIQSLQLTPWLVLAVKPLPRFEFAPDPIEENKHWLAQIVGAEVVFNDEGDPEPGAKVVDKNGQVGLVPPTLYQAGIVIKI